MLDPNKSADYYADAYVHLLLTQEEAAAVEERVAADKAWAHALEDARRRKAILESVPPAEAPEELVRNTISQIGEKVQRRQNTWRAYSRTVAALAVAAAALIAVVNSYYASLAPSPYDVRILGQDNLLSGAPAALRVTVFNRETGEQVQGVPVQLAIYNPRTREEVQLGSFASGEELASRFEVPDWEPGNYELRVLAQPDGHKTELTESLALRREWKLMLSSDKPLYQPGQTIHVRALALRKPDQHPVAGEEMLFTIQDPKGNIIFKQREKGSDFGIAAVDCALAQEILTGQYKLVCQIGDTVSEQTVTVQKYVLPKFKVAVSLDKSFYGPGDTVTGSIRADYFYGKPVTGGEVKLDALTADVEALSLASILEETDENGKATFEFDLPKTLIGREQDGGNARFVVTATVTDTAGQKYEQSASRVVTSKPISLEVIPEAGSLVKGVANKVYIFASYVDGRSAEVDLKINGDEYQAKTNSMGVASIEITPKENEVGLLVVATDKEDRVGRKHVKLVTGRVASDFIVRTDKATYNGGETMTLSALGGGVEPIFVDFLKDGQTMLTTTIPMEGGKGEMQFDLPAEMFGTLELNAYRLGKAGLAVRKTKMLFIRQPKQLQIAATLDKDEYRPGVSAKLNLAITDAEGKPVPGAISLAAVDEAVFSVLGQKPGMEQVFFLLEQELLEPVYAIYNWDPFADPNGNAPMPGELVELEQAIFSRTSAAAEGYDAVPAEFANPKADAISRMEEEFFDEDVAVDMAFAADEGIPVYRPSGFSLSAASYWADRSELQQRRNFGLESCYVAWGVWFGLLCLVGVGTFAVYRPIAFAITAGISLAVLVPVTGLLFVSAVVLTKSEMAPTAGIDATMENGDMAMMFDGAEAMAWEGAEDDADFGEPGELATIEPTSEEPSGGAAPAKPRVRQHFPETLLWMPEIVTDENGKASLEIQLADSITSWRVTTSAVSAEGQLGSGTQPIRVFQPFFVDVDLPVSLTRNDEVSLRVVVSNYLDEAQTVTLDLEAADWFTRLDADGEPLADNPSLKIEMAASERNRAVLIPIRVKDVGQQSLQVTAIGSHEIGDAVKRQIEVVPDGVRVEQVASGTLDSPAEMLIELPAAAIPGSSRTIVKIYPTTFSQLVEGLDAIFQMPYGCFEQTSSTTYPNILALDYMRRTKLNAPEVEAKASNYINLGYQRLVSFEVNGGGFDWFGNPPANETLTAYGLMEFEDMARVHDVDPDLIRRTRNWLLSKRQKDGRWKADPNMLNDGLAGSVQQGKDLDLATTAYIAWAVFGSGEATDQAELTLDYLLAREPASIDNPYMLALIANCIAGIDPGHKSLGEYFARLDSMKEQSEDGKRTFWKQAEGTRTMFYGDGRSGDVETTAMAAIALMKSGQYPASVRGSLSWLVSQKDAQGTWFSTQATVLALKALVEGTGKAIGGDKPRTIEIALDGQVLRTIDIPVDQADVMQQLNLTEEIAAGSQTLSIKDVTNQGTGYQVAFWYYEEATEPEVTEPEPLTIDITYDREKLSVEDTVTAKATVVNNLEAAAPMVIVDLPIPGGFKLEADGLQKLVEAGKIAKFQLTARKAIVYLRDLRPGKTLELDYQLRATLPVKVTVPAGAVYEYYNPDVRAESKVSALEAT